MDKKFILLSVAVAIFFAAASIYYYHKTVQPDSGLSMVDFRVYYDAGVGLESGANIYGFNDDYFFYKYSPIFALIMSVIRFSTFSPAGALCVWYAVLFICFILSLYLTGKILFEPQARATWKFIDIVAILFISRYFFLINFIHPYIASAWPFAVRAFDAALLYILVPICLCSLFFGMKEDNKNNYLPIMILSVLATAKFTALNINRAQVNIVVLVLILFFVYYHMSRREILAGLYLGLGIMIKLMPAIFLIYLILKKKIRTLLSSVITCIALLILPSFKVGFNRNAELITSWFEALKKTMPNEYIQHKNQSLLAALSRYGSANSDISIMKLNETHLQILVALAYIAVILWIVFAVRGRRGEDESREALYNLGIFFAGMVLLFPVGAKTTFIFLLFPMAMLIKEACARRWKDLLLNAGLLFCITVFYLDSSDIIGDLSIVLNKYSIMTFCLIVIMALAAYLKKPFLQLTKPS